MEQFTSPQETNAYMSSSATDPFATMYEDATTGQRFLNYVIDKIIVYILAYGLGIMLAVGYYASGNEPDFENFGSSRLILYLMVLLLILVYYTFSEAVSHGRSIGKLITGTKAVRIDETDITLKDALIRTLCRIVPFEALSGLGGYPWHDSWSNTKVIRLRK